MKAKLVLNGVKPISINSTYFSTGSGFIKTTAARDWTYEVCYHLASPENEQQLDNIRATFDPKKHTFKISVEAKYPKKIFITRQGSVSAKTIDVTNWEKSLIDVIFLSKNYSENPPYGCKNLNTDDRYITEMHSKKSISPDGKYHIHIEIELLDLDI